MRERLDPSGRVIRKRSGRGTGRRTLDSGRFFLVVHFWRNLALKLECAVKFYDTTGEAIQTENIDGAILYVVKSG
jgi:hypothetical protein